VISLKIQNAEVFSISQIPFLEKKEFFDSLIKELDNGLRMIGFFPPDPALPQRLVAILSDSRTSFIHIIGGILDKREFESLSSRFPQVFNFECELFENYGFLPLNHPHLSPVRKENLNGNQPYAFYQIQSNEIHEVAVGPIHAGVIEPGHFRFQCHGEQVHHLEIRLGYQHRGIESLILKASPSKKILLSESIAGDTVIGHAYAHCQAVESLSETQISLRAQTIRSIAEELERTAMHISSLGGMSNDIGLAIASSSYGRLRTLVINSLAELCGSRYGRGLFVYGGVRFDFSKEILKTILSNLKTVFQDIAEIHKFLFSSVGSCVRFEKTGVVSKEKAEAMGLTGQAARSSGIGLDTRIQHPYGAYRYFPVLLNSLSSGDVFARAFLRTLEIEESMKFIFEQVDSLPEGRIKSEISSLPPDCAVVSMTEGFRGEIVHSAWTDKKGALMQYKIKDPSFNNWLGLSLAMEKTAISDFPLCNKSFDLSYAGHDL